MPSHQRPVVVKSVEIIGKSDRRGEATRNNPVLGIMPHIMEARLISGAIAATDIRPPAKTSKRALNDLD
jgi:hypothetical protein